MHRMLHQSESSISESHLMSIGDNFYIVYVCVVLENLIGIKCDPGSQTQF